MLSAVLATPDSRSVLIHLLNCTDFPAGIGHRAGSGNLEARPLYQPGMPERTLELYPVNDGAGVDIDRVPVLATLRLD